MEGAPPPPGRRVDRRLKEDQNSIWTSSISSPISVGPDFFEDADMTGEVMNLDDFLKELQSNETSSRPASTPPVRLSVFQSVGRAPELKIRTNVAEMQEPSMASVAAPPEEQKPAIPKASVRPQLREMGGTGKRKAATSTAVRAAAQVKKERLDPLEEEMEEEEAEASRVGVESKTSSNRKSSKEEQEGFTTTVCVNFSADDLRLATIPGQEEDFDPATRRFSEDELKPQPIIRKRRKQFVPDDMKNSKYWQKRVVNNQAAKRSREARRLKENQIAMRARFLEEENNALKLEVEGLKKENGDLRLMMQTLEEKIDKVAASRQ